MENVLFLQYEVLWNLSNTQSSVLHALDTLRPQVDVSLPLPDRYQSGAEDRNYSRSNSQDKI